MTEQKGSLSKPSKTGLITVSGTIIQGHGVASGTGSDKTYPDSTILMQTPFFKEKGLDLSQYFIGTLNVSIAPKKFELVAPEYYFPNIEWTKQIPPETFSFSPCSLIFENASYECLIYYPHPETKVVHPQPPTMLEIIGPKITDIKNGSSVELRLSLEEIRIFE